MPAMGQHMGGHSTGFAEIPPRDTGWPRYQSGFESMTGTNSPPARGGASGQGKTRSRRSRRSFLEGEMGSCNE